MRRKTHAGMTLIELLIVVAIVAVLIALSLPAILRAREASIRTACAANLAQLGKAVHSYHLDHGRLPPYASGGNIYGSWFVHLLPYVGERELFGQIVVQQDSDSLLSTVTDDSVRTIRFPLLICGADPTAHDRNDDTGRTSYLGNWYVLADGSAGAYSPSRRFADLVDGTSNVVLFAEAYSICAGLTRPALLSDGYHNFGITQEGKPSDDSSYDPLDYTMFQIQPALSDCNKWRTQSAHINMPVAMADGSVQAVSADISPLTWKQLLKPRDGLPSGSEF